MAATLDARIRSLIDEPDSVAAGDKDLVAALLAIMRRDHSSYGGRRDLFALERRFNRLTADRPLPEDLANRWLKGDKAAELMPAPPVPAPHAIDASSPLETLYEQVARLLATPSPRVPGDLDLADAIVAILWRQVRHYQGSADIWEVERAIADYRARPAFIEAAAITRLASTEFLREAAALRPEEAKPAAEPATLPDKSTLETVSYFMLQGVEASGRGDS